MARNLRSVVLSAFLAAGVFVGANAFAPVQATTPEQDEPIESTVSEEFEAAEVDGLIDDYTEEGLAAAKEDPISVNMTTGKASTSAIDIFPIQQNAKFSDTWGAPRGGGTRRHIGTDVMSKQMNETYAAVSGTVRQAKGEGVMEGSYASSFYLLVDGDDGRSYFYVHLNNDTPGRPKGCDGKGGMENAFSPKLVEYYKQHKTLKGARVERGEHIGYVGSSGNASCGIDHIHFEIWPGHGWAAQKQAMNPYPILKAAYSNHGAPYDNKGIATSGRTSTPAPVQTQTPAKPSTPTPTLTGAQRISAPERVGTAARLSTSSFASANVAVVVPANTYHGALLGSPLASMHRGPVLLSDTKSLSQGTADELKRLGTKKVYAIGPMSGAVRDLKKLGLEVVAVDDKSQAKLAVKVADLIAQAGANDSKFNSIENRHVILVSGDQNAWPDALAGSVLAATDHAPVFFSDRDAISAETLAAMDALNPGRISVIGGASRISDKVLDQLRSRYMLVNRLSGAGRVETALQVTSYMVDDNPAIADRVFVATAANYPDALAAGPALAAQGGVLVLANPSGSNDAVRQWINTHGAPSELFVIGGTTVMPNAAVNAITGKR